MGRMVFKVGPQTKTEKKWREKFVGKWEIQFEELMMFQIFVGWNHQLVVFEWREIYSRFE